MVTSTETQRSDDASKDIPCCSTKCGIGDALILGNVSRTTDVPQ